ncbi:MAG: TRAP transporter large permease [Firmicutes bacterium]|jgi:tripartite ATP-independent transporter DctM subunit|nr:TRAP transporter large permease [Bacillota bacterium]
MASFAMIFSFLVFMFLSVPISVSLALSASLAVYLLDFPLVVVTQRIFNGIDSFPLLAIPFFILTGLVLGTGTTAKRLVSLSNVIVGRMRGGLAMVNIVASMFFAGISGSAVADTSSIGSLLIPIMKEKGYDEDFTVAVTVTSSTIGLIIPPSNSMIVYSMVAGGISIGSLFLAGVIPGILVGISLMIVSYIISVRRDYPKEDPISSSKAWEIIKEAFPALLTVIIILGGIIGGMFTATEAAVVAAAYSIVLAVFVYREVGFRELADIFYQCTCTTAIVMLLLGASTAFAWVMAFEGIPTRIASAILGITDNPYILLLLINILLLFVGLFMDLTPAMLIFTPILLPIATSIGLSPIHFGIIMLINLCIGLCTPPVGAVLFVGCAIARVPMTSIIRPLVLLLLPMVGVLLLVTYVPAISMFLPGLLMK